MSLGLDRGLDIGSLQYIDGVAYFTDIRSYHTQHENIIGAPKMCDNYGAIKSFYRSKLVLIKLLQLIFFAKRGLSLFLNLRGDSEKSYFTFHYRL